eukprot:gene10035-12304_t
MENSNATISTTTTNNYSNNDYVFSCDICHKKIFKNTQFHFNNCISSYYKNQRSLELLKKQINNEDCKQFVISNVIQSKIIVQLYEIISLEPDVELDPNRDGYFSRGIGKQFFSLQNARKVKVESSIFYKYPREIEYISVNHNQSNTPSLEISDDVKYYIRKNFKKIFFPDFEDRDLDWYRVEELKRLSRLVNEYRLININLSNHQDINNDHFIESKDNFKEFVRSVSDKLEVFKASEFTEGTDWILLYNQTIQREREMNSFAKDYEHLFIKKLRKGLMSKLDLEFITSHREIKYLKINYNPDLFKLFSKQIYNSDSNYYCEYDSFCPDKDSNVKLVCTPYINVESQTCNNVDKLCKPESLQCNNGTCQIIPYLGAGEKCSSGSQCKTPLVCSGDNVCALPNGEECSGPDSDSCQYGLVCRNSTDSNGQYKCQSLLKLNDQCLQTKECEYNLVCTFLDNNDANNFTKTCQPTNSKKGGDRCGSNTDFHIDSFPRPECDTSEGLICFPKPQVNKSSVCVSKDSVATPSSYNCDKQDSSCPSTIGDEVCICNGDSGGGICTSTFDLNQSCKNFTDQLVKCAMDNQCILFNNENSRTCLYTKCNNLMCNSNVLTPLQQVQQVQPPQQPPHPPLVPQLPLLPQPPETQII